MSGGPGSTRNTLLAAAAGIGVAAAILELAAHALDFAYGLSLPFYLTSLNVANGLEVLSAGLAIGGFAAALAGFMFVPQPSRRRLLGIAAILFLAAALSAVAVQTIAAVEYGTHGLPGTLTASFAVAAAAWLALGSAGLIAAVALLSSTAGRGPDQGLGWAGIGLAVFFVVDLVATLLRLIAYSDFHAPSGITSGLGVAVGGDAVAAAGAVLVAAAFLIAASRAHSRPDWLAGRDGLLAIATIVLALGFLLVSIGGMIEAAADSAEDTKVVASNWLTAISWLGLAFAAVSASVGFAKSRSAAQRAQSTPAADPGAFGSA